MTITVEFPSLASGLALSSTSASGREPVVDESGVLSRAETAECTCPEFCERDHANE
jgi:hypothetical protein